MAIEMNFNLRYVPVFIKYIVYKGYMFLEYCYRSSITWMRFCSLLYGSGKGILALRPHVSKVIWRKEREALVEVYQNENVTYNNNTF